MLKVSKRFGIDELKMVLEKYYDNSKISYIEETLIMTMYGLMEILQFYVFLVNMSIVMMLIV